jgi:hypothetical protein
LDYCREDEYHIRQLLQSTAPPIIRAIQNKKGEQLETVLREDPTAVEARYMSRTPLLLSVDQLIKRNDTRQIELLQILLKHGAEPNTSSINHDTNKETNQPLYQICSALRDAHGASNHEAIQTLTKGARILFDYGARPMESTQLLLQDAAREGRIPFLDFLVTVLKIDAEHSR